MTDGNIEALKAFVGMHAARMQAIGARHLEATGAKPSFKAGEEVSLIDPDDGVATLTIGEEYCDSRTLAGPVKTGKLVGASAPALWDERTDQWLDCTPSRLEAYKFAEVEWSDGNVGLIGARFLYGAFRSEKDLKAPPLHFLTYDEMVALPDPHWLIEGLIMERTSALMFGKSNSFKSFLAIDMACALATGQPWHCVDIEAPAPVLYIATEGALGVAKQRIPGWMDDHGVAHELRQNIELHPQEIAVDDETAIDDVLKTLGYMNARRKMANGEKVWSDIDPCGAVKLIVVDIFGASMNGPETSDETARAWVRNVNRLMREVGCAVLTVAHTGWADETRARMHTHFWGSFDTRMKAVGDKDSLTTVLTIDRHKDADSSGKWGFRLDKVTMTDGQTTLVPRLCDDVETSQKRRVSGKPAVALQALSEALIEHGRTIAGPNYPACPVVTVEQWRVMADRHGLTDSDNPDTKRKTFNRHKDTLLEKALVRQFDGHVWKVSVDG